LARLQARVGDAANDEVVGQSVRNICFLLAMTERIEIADDFPAAAELGALWDAYRDEKADLAEAVMQFGEHAPSKVFRAWDDAFAEAQMSLVALEDRPPGTLTADERADPN